MELTQGFVQLLEVLAPAFHKPTFPIFVELMTGWVLSHRHRYVTDLILSSDSVGKRHFSTYHRFFSKAAWNLDVVSKLLFLFLVAMFAPTGMITVIVDDTLCRKRGLTLYGAGMHHDPLLSSKAKKITSWGHDWVVLCIAVQCPWAPTKIWALPICFRFYRNRQGLTKGKKNKKNKKKKAKADPNHRTRPQLAVEMLELVASWLPDRQFLLMGDSAYSGRSVLQKLPENMEAIGHVHPKGALYKPAPKPKPNQKGRHRKKGERLPGMQEWADNKTAWRTLKFDQFGLHATLKVKVRKALYYKAGKDRLLTIVLVRDVLGKRPDQMFYCTQLEWDARQILSHYASRWAIEVTFENAKQLLGFEDPANRVPKAVLRTAPMALVLYSLIVAWCHKEGHRHIKFPNRPWYPKKREPSFADMLTTLRRLSWEDKYRPLASKSGPLKKCFAQIAYFLSLAG